MGTESHYRYLLRGRSSASGPQVSAAEIRAYSKFLWRVSAGLMKADILAAQPRKPRHGVCWASSIGHCRCTTALHATGCMNMVPAVGSSGRRRSVPCDQSYQENFFISIPLGFLTKIIVYCAFVKLCLADQGSD
eukprot:jgi/Botrbrau1/3494/Bobra.341_2s0024.1